MRTYEGRCAYVLVPSRRPYASPSRVRAEYDEHRVRSSQRLTGPKELPPGLGLVLMTDNAGVKTYPLVDGLGSTANVIDTAGNVVGSYTYDAFGAVRTHSGASTEFSFTGEQNDPNGLEYLRYYNSAMNTMSS